MSWLYLLGAAFFEIVWAFGLKFAGTHARPNIVLAGTFAAYVVSFLMLAIALRGLPLGTAYAVWTGIGTLGATVIGIMLFGESATPARVVCIGLIVLGIAGLKVTSGVEVSALR